MFFKVFKFAKLLIVEVKVDLVDKSSRFILWLIKFLFSLLLTLNKLVLSSSSLDTDW